MSIGRWLVVCGLVLGPTPAMADKMADVELGSPFDPAAWETSADGTPSRLGTVAGVQGTIVPQTCGNTITGVMFFFTSTNASKIGEPGIARAEDPAADAGAVYSALAAALATAGYERTSLAVGEWVKSASGSGEKTYRRLSAIRCVPLDALNMTRTCTVSLAAWRPGPPCTAGLE